MTKLEPNLSTVRLARYSANAIPRNTPVLADVDDINTHVGFWAPQADFRIPERLSPGFGPFPDLELEAVYEDLVRTFVDYQTRVALRAIARNPSADLVMVYIEQPDGSEHQFLLTDPRQPTEFTNPNSIGAGQDAGKVARYHSYIRVNVDLLVEVYKNSEKIAEGLVRCITGLTRDPGRAKEVVVAPTLGSAQTFSGDTDALSVKLLTRIGTNPDDTKCAGAHASAVGVRAYFDAVGRASRLDAGLEEN